MSDELKIIGERLKSIRKLTGLNRRKLCSIYNMHEDTLKRWEQGMMEIGSLKLAKYLANFKDFNIYVSADAVLNTQSDFLPPKTVTQNFNIMTISLRNLESSNGLFYIKPDGLIVYLNPRYKDIIGSSTLNKTAASSTLYLQDILEHEQINKIIHSPGSNSQQVITINNKLSNLPEILTIELYSDFDIYNNITGIAGFLLSNSLTNQKGSNYD